VVRPQPNMILALMSGTNQSVNGWRPIDWPPASPEKEIL
jgi:hypothetical protein